MGGGLGPLVVLLGQHRVDHVDQGGAVGEDVRDHQFDARQVAGDDGAREGQPAGAVLGDDDVQTKDLAVPVEA